MTRTPAERVAAALDGPVPALAPGRRLWLVGTGPFHDAAELGTFTFAGSGRSAAVVAGEGHARLGELIGPQDACVLVGGGGDLERYATRAATGAGAVVARLEVPADPADDPTTSFATAGACVLALCHSLDAPGVTEDDLRRLSEAVGLAASTVPDLARHVLGDRAIIMGSGPAAVTARHLAVVLRRLDPGVEVEGLDAQNVPGAAAHHLGVGTTVVALDPDRDDTAPVARVARMASAEGAHVVTVPTDHDLSPVAAQIPLAVGASIGLRRR